MCVHVKYQPDLTCKRIIRILWLNIAASRLAASEMTFVWYNGDSQPRSRWLKCQSLWLCSAQARDRLIFVQQDGKTDGSETPPVSWREEAQACQSGVVEGGDGGPGPG